jgi:hypothetical protein
MTSGKNSLQLPIIFSSALLIMVNIILFDRNQQQQQIWQQMNGDNRAAEQLIRNQLAALYGDISIISDQSMQRLTTNECVKQPSRVF